MTLIDLQMGLSGLTELDLTDFHHEYSEDLRISAIRGSPLLRVLALPSCFLIPLKGKNGTVDGGLQVLTRALEESELTKLFLKCGSSSICQRCTHSFSSANLVKLSGLKQLRELNVSELRLRTFALENLGNANLRTVRFNDVRFTDFSGLSRFLQKCPNLTNFKFRHRMFPAHLREIKETLNGIASLRQLCLEPIFLGSRSYASHSAMIRMLSELPKTIEHVHYHVPLSLWDQFRSDSLTERIEEREMIRKGRLNVEIVGGCMCDFMTSQQSFHGRGLCFTESLVGHVKPLCSEIE